MEIFRNIYLHFLYNFLQNKKLILAIRATTHLSIVLWPEKGYSQLFQPLSFYVSTFMQKHHPEAVSCTDSLNEVTFSTSNTVSNACVN